MKYFAVVLFAIGAFAHPQEAEVTNAPVAPSYPSGLTPAVSCAMACEAGDVTCQAQCMGNARPNASQAIATNECAAKCDQGDGSKAASDDFGRCIDACINSLFPSSQTAFGGPHAAAVASNVAIAVSSAAKSANPTATPGKSIVERDPYGCSCLYIESTSSSGSDASPVSTGAADVNCAHLAGAGLAGLFALFVL